MTSEHHSHPEKTETMTLSSIRFYAPPIQRQKWGDTQIHPVTNYGDLFFDLFYVSAAYNLGNLLRVDTNATGLLYFVAIFWAIYFLWFDKTGYDARFCYQDTNLMGSYGFDIARFLILAYTVSHIDTVSILSNPSQQMEMFAVCFGVALGNALGAVRSLDVAVNAIGDPAARKSGWRDLQVRIIPLVFSTAATVVAGVQHYRHHVEEEEKEEESYAHDDHADDDHHRFLAGEESNVAENPSTTHIPAFLLFLGSFCVLLSWCFLLFTMPKNGLHKKITVPMNVDFTIHRYGEWILLMLGESVLSLLIVDVPHETRHYYNTFISGILSVALLQQLHFRSQPHHADDHAMRRSKEGGFTWAILMQIYSAALIVLGAMYKNFLYDFGESEGGGGAHRHRALWSSSSILGRFLAATTAATDSSIDREDQRQRNAHFFCAAMAIVWFCLDAMILTHKGIHLHLDRCRQGHCPKTTKNHKLLKFLGFLCVVLRFGLLIFMATLSQYLTTPHWLSIVGFFGIVAQIGLRVAAVSLYPEESHIDQDIVIDSAAEQAFKEKYGDCDDKEPVDDIEDEDDDIEQ